MCYVLITERKSANQYQYWSMQYSIVAYICTCMYTCVMLLMFLWYAYICVRVYTYVHTHSGGWVLYIAYYYDSIVQYCGQNLENGDYILDK